MPSRIEIYDINGCRIDVIARRATPDAAISSNQGDCFVANASRNDGISEFIWTPGKYLDFGVYLVATQTGLRQGSPTGEAQRLLKGRGHIYASRPARCEGQNSSSGTGHCFCLPQFPHISPHHIISKSELALSINDLSSVSIPTSKLRRFADFAPIPAPVIFAEPI